MQLFQGRSTYADVNSRPRNGNIFQHTHTHQTVKLRIEWIKRDETLLAPVFLLGPSFVGAAGGWVPTYASSFEPGLPALRPLVRTASVGQVASAKRAAS